jgi:4-hydroxy-2-oxoheptanedioate aldolase
MKNLKEKILTGNVVHGCWINLGSTVSAEIVGRAGFDWVLIDLEHGVGNDVIMFQQLQALEHTGVTPLVRTDDHSRPKIQRILDAGSYGVMFPQLQHPEEAELAIKTMYYPPRGIRGMAKMVRATGFGKNADHYIANLQNHLVGIIQIETINALQQIDSIAKLDGVDVLFIGPADLSLALGIFGQFTHPLYQQALKDVAQAAKKYNKAAGVLMLDINEYKMYYDHGYRFLACGGDSSFVAKGADEVVKQMNKFAGK